MSNPSANVSVSSSAGAGSTGADVVCVIAPVASSADYVPRLYGSAAAIEAQHGYGLGSEYAEYHLSRTRKPVLFVGCPIDTEGAIVGPDNRAIGLTVDVAVSSAAGVLGLAHDAILRMHPTTWVNQPLLTADYVLQLSCDAGHTWKDIRFVSGVYEIPKINVTITLSDLDWGDLEADANASASMTIATWRASQATIAAAAYEAARLELREQEHLFRAAIAVGSLVDEAEGTAAQAMIDTYETGDQRYAELMLQCRDRARVVSMAAQSHRMSGTPNLTFAEVGASGDTITRSAGSWITDGFAPGDLLNVTGSASNNITGTAIITAVSAAVLTLGTDDLVAEGPVAGVTVVGHPALSFDAGTDIVTRYSGSWVDEGFRIGDTVTIDGTGSNDGTEVVVLVTPLAMTLTTLATEIIRSTSVTITAGTEKAAWMTAEAAEFASITSDRRVCLHAGHAARQCTRAGWRWRVPCSWHDTVRWYEHDVHRPPWRKDDGPIAGATLRDADDALIEWDDHVDGGAGSANRITTHRSWPNGPAGVFIAQSLTRAEDGDALSYLHNAAVANVVCTVVQAVTENFAGRTPETDADGAAKAFELSLLEGEVNDELRKTVLRSFGEGPRASACVWVATRGEDIRSPGSVLTGVATLDLNGTIHTVNTTVLVR